MVGVGLGRRQVALLRHGVLGIEQHGFDLARALFLGHSRWRRRGLGSIGRVKQRTAQECERGAHDER